MHRAFIHMEHPWCVSFLSLPVAGVFRWLLLWILFYTFFLFFFHSFLASKHVHCRHVCLCVLSMLSSQLSIAIVVYILDVICEPNNVAAWCRSSQKNIKALNSMHTIRGDLINAPVSDIAQCSSSFPTSRCQTVFKYGLWFFIFISFDSILLICYTVAVGVSQLIGVCPLYAIDHRLISIRKF